MQLKKSSVSGQSDVDKKNEGYRLLLLCIDQLQMISHELLLLIVTIALQYAMINIVHALTMTFLSNGFHWLC